MTVTGKVKSVDALRRRDPAQRRRPATCLEISRDRVEDMRQHVLQEGDEVSALIINVDRKVAL